MKNTSQIKMLEIQIHTIDQFVDVYTNRLKELKAHREQLMNELVGLRMVPIIEV
jgi:hypothetical protein